VRRLALTSLANGACGAVDDELQLRGFGDVDVGQCRTGRAPARCVARRQPRRLELGGLPVEIDALGDRQVEQTPVQVEVATEQRHRSAKAGVELGRTKALARHDPVDREDTPIRVHVAQMPADAPCNRTHVRAVFGCGIPERRCASVVEPARARTPKDEHLAGPQRQNVRVVGEHHAVDAARDAFEKRHHAHTLGVLSEERRRCFSLGVAAHPAQAFASAVHPLTRVCDPDRTITGVQVGRSPLELGEASWHHVRWRSLDVECVPHGVYDSLVLQLLPGGGALGPLAPPGDPAAVVEGSADDPCLTLGVEVVDVVDHCGRQIRERIGSPVNEPEHGVRVDPQVDGLRIVLADPHVAGTPRGADAEDAAGAELPQRVGGAAR